MYTKTIRNVTIVAGAVGAVLAASAANAALVRMPTQVQLIPNLQNLIVIKSVSCTVAGTPVEFPDDVRLRNTGNVTLPAGTKINWHLHASAYGVHTLAAALAPNQYAFLSGVVPGGWPGGVSCSASIQ